MLVLAERKEIFLVVLACGGSGDVGVGDCGDGGSSTYQGSHLPLLECCHDDS